MPTPSRSQAPKPPSKEAWEEWRAQPLSRAFFQATKAYSENRKAAWLAQMWKPGSQESPALLDLKCRAQVAEDFSAMTYEMFLEFFE